MKFQGIYSLGWIITGRTKSCHCWLSKSTTSMNVSNWTFPADRSKLVGNHMPRKHTKEVDALYLLLILRHSYFSTVFSSITSPHASNIPLAAASFFSSFAAIMDHRLLKNIIYSPPLGCAGFKVRISSHLLPKCSSIFTPYLLRQSFVGLQAGSNPEPAAVLRNGFNVV